MIPDTWQSGKMPNGRAESTSLVPRLSVRGGGAIKCSMRKFGEMIQLFGMILWKCIYMVQHFSLHP